MARPMKKGLDYFPFDVDIFSDRKIKVLYSRFGADGFTLYSYLLCQIFREGYYLSVDEDLNYLIASDLNMNAEKIGLMMNFLLERSLFDNKRFRSEKILTSAGIQRRYQQAVRTRAAKKQITVEERFWLLDKEETEAFIQVRSAEGFSGKNEHNSGNNPDNSRNNDTKKSKGKESKRKESKVCLELPCLDGSFVITEDDLGALTHTYPEMNVESSLQKLRSYLTANPHKQGTLSSTHGYVEMWLSEDDRKGRYRSHTGEYNATYDISDYESTSVIDEDW